MVSVDVSLVGVEVGIDGPAGSVTYIRMPGCGFTGDGVVGPAGVVGVEICRVGG